MSNSLAELTSDFVHEQKFYLALYSLPHLMIEMSDPRKNITTQAILFGADSFDLIFPYLLDLFENPKTCVNSFLYLFNKLPKFVSRNELAKKFLPILLHVLNIVDLNQTIGIDLNANKDEEKLKFCKLFEYTFINELRIIFGQKIFLTQICPFLIEAISGLKDFEYETDHLSLAQNESSVHLNKEEETNEQMFSMENLNQSNDALKMLDEENLAFEDQENVYNFSSKTK
jgi:hypothetical protein